MLFTQACGSVAQQTPSTGAASTASTVGKGPTTLNYGYIGTSKLNFPSGAEGWGFYKGIIQEELKKHGITDVKLTAFPNGPDLSESLISGRLDVGSLGDTPAILSRSTGAKTRFITQGSTSSIGYLIGKKNGPQTLAELKGKTVATQKGSFHHRYLAGLLKENNMTDVKIVHLLRVDAEAALARGEIDAMTNTDVFALKQIDQGYPLIDDATKHTNLLGTSATVTTEDYLSKKADFPKIWNEIRLKVLNDLKTKPDEYYKFLAELNNSTPELMQKVSPISNIKDVPFTDEGIKLLEGTKKFLVDEKLAEKDFDLNQWILK
ncbi:transporter substrate-binding domain-containing protein [Paenibacillus sp. LMG 31456]|uniref:Transporter substrate-binding domain-containing protein n=2 Tax=Paenibacillus foliorum TaxID=2654974 RepID=A0A972GL32_9BACL|nr:transporter substrate-binding domain-containing protein [Paenibacillus foliorum]